MGGYGQTATSVFVHAPVAINCFSANENESTHYPTLYERTAQALGEPPEAIAADRAYSINPIYEHNTRRGVATVVPWRKPADITNAARWTANAGTVTACRAARIAAGPATSKDPAKACTSLAANRAFASAASFEPRRVRAPAFDRVR